MRGISKEQYTRNCEALWEQCKTDRVYKAKIFVEPLVDKQLADGSDDIFCVLVARSDPDGQLIDAPPGYHRSEEKGTRLARIVIGTPHVVDTKRTAKSKVQRYLFAYFDILGFKNKVSREKIDKVHKTYIKFIDDVVNPQQRPFSKALALNSCGDLVQAFVYTVIEMANYSDSLILYAPYRPDFEKFYYFAFVEQFLERCALLFCLALRAHVPLRGVITAGEGVFHAKTNVFLGQPLIEASTLEKELDWLGVAFGKSATNGLPLSPRLIQFIAPPTTAKGETLAAELVLDWPRVWRTAFFDPVMPYIAKLYEEAERDDSLEVAERDKIQARYENAAIFFEFSKMRQNWFLPKGHTMLTPEDVWNNPAEGADLRFLYRDHRYLHRLGVGAFSIHRHLQSLKSWVAHLNPVDIEAWDHNLNHVLFRPAPNRLKRN